jgi:heme a synthase
MVPFDHWRHRYAVVCAFATAGLLIAGGLVTSTGSGLAVPDWPLSFGKVFPPMTGGVLFEHGHRLVAATVGLLTIVLAVWFGRSETRAWVRRLSYLAIGAVIAQGLLGGLTVLLRLPPSVSVLHACLAQGFFCIIVLLAVCTSKGFVDPPRAVPPALGASSWIPGAVATGLVFTQLVLGAVMRHTGAGLAIPDVPLAFGRLVPPLPSFEIAVHYAHRVMAIVVAGAVFVSAVPVLRRRPAAVDLLRPARLAVVLVLLQITLGATTVVTRLAVLPATAHVFVGALLLATCLVLTVRVARLAASRTPEAARDSGRHDAAGPVTSAHAAGSAA